MARGLAHRNPGKHDMCATQFDRNRNTEQSGRSTPAFNCSAADRTQSVACVPELASRRMTGSSSGLDPVREQLGMHRAPVIKLASVIPSSMVAGDDHVRLEHGQRFIAIMMQSFRAAQNQSGQPIHRRCASRHSSANSHASYPGMLGTPKVKWTIFALGSGASTPTRWFHHPASSPISSSDSQRSI